MSSQAAIRRAIDATATRVRPVVRSAWQPRAVVAILALYLVLAGWYSVAIPPWEATDELLHFQHALFLRDQHRLPRQSHDPAQLEAATAHHPPLYYAVLALVGVGLDTSDLGQVARPNLAYSWGNRATGGPYVFLHDEAQERFPYRGTLLALHLFRLVSVVAGGVTVFASWRIARLLMGGDRWLAVATAAAVAFLPSFLFTSATVHNDNFVTLYGVLATWQALRIAELGSTPTRGAVLGLLVGAAVLSKVSGLVFLALPFLLALVELLRQRRLRPPLVGLTTALLAFLLATGWWFLRNHALYGDPLGWSVFATNAIFPIRSTPAGFAELLYEWLPPQNLLFRTFVLAFGFMDHHAPAWVYDVAWTSILAGLAGLALAVARRPDAARQLLRTARFWLVVTLVFLLAASLTRYMMGFRGGGHGRYLFPVLPLLSFAILLGLAWFLPRRLAPVLPITALAGLLALAVAFPPLIAGPTYAVAGRVATASLPAQPVARFGDVIELLDARVEPSTATPGGSIAVTLRWRGLRRLPENYVAFVHLVDQQNRGVASLDSAPVAGRAPTSLWQAGDVIADTVYLSLPADLSLGLYRVETGFYRRPSLERLPVSTGSAARSVVAALVKVPPPATPRLAGARAIEVPFGSAIRLLDVEVPSVLRPGEALPVRLLWSAEGSPGQDYTLSLQMLSASGQLVSQKDLQPQNGNYPTSAWEAGDLVSDRIEFPVPSSLAAGPYRLIAVLYDVASGQRLPTPTGDFAEMAVFDYP